MIRPDAGFVVTTMEDALAVRDWTPEHGVGVTVRPVVLSWFQIKATVAIARLGAGPLPTAIL